ncbi:MAG TPA: HPr family phosphocarrier protein [Pseudobdellovibrionaceae bacterium]
MEIKLRLLNEEGMHARPAGILVKAISSFQSKVELEFNGKSINAKSLLSILSLGLTFNSEFMARAEGSDAALALKSIESLIQNKFQV